MKIEKKDKIPAYKVKRHWMYAPSTYLLDSWEPVVEEIYLPEVASKAGELSFNIIADGLTESKCGSSLQSKLKRALFNKEKERRVNDDRTIVDLRVHSPENLAHAITNHLPLALLAKEFLNETNQSEPLLLLPSELPKYIETIFLSVGFKVLLTDSPVRGKACDFSVTPWIAIRGIRHTVIQKNLSGSDFAEVLYKKSLTLPKKVFISRRDTRCISNEKEVELFLNAKGYQKIYLEDYDILEQIALVSLADNIVAIHGAALGGLLFRGMYRINPIQVVELFSPGHITNVYRMVTQQISGNWVGVRGKLWPDIIQQAYSIPKKIHRFAYDNFEVCVLSLEKAMERGYDK